MKVSPQVWKILLILAFVAIGGGWYFIRSHRQPVIYYGYLRQISSSGEARFGWYDMQSVKPIDPENQYAWFWALPPEKITNNQELANQWFNYIKTNNDEVFKISGIRNKDDCGYYDESHCVQDIEIQSIEVVGSDDAMNFTD